MWDAVGNIAAIVVIILLFQLLGLPDWLDKFFNKRSSASALANKVAELEGRVASLEKKSV